jgi:hypothetical protein
LLFVALLLPSGDFFDMGFFVRDATVKALALQYAELDFRPVQPTGVFGRVVAPDAPLSTEYNDFPTQRTRSQT